MDIDNYKIILVNDTNKFKHFMEYLNKSYEENNKFVSIDFEYTKNKIQLWQICFYDTNTIFVIQSKLINDTDMQIIIKKLLISKIIKIFHGAESLDFPYLFGVLKEPKLIYKFLKHTFDTRFICEYYKLKTNSTNRLCNVYDAMLFFNALKKDKYDELQIMNKKIGPIWKVNWNNIDRDSNLLKYTIYDVIYLKKLLLKSYNMYKELNLTNDFYDLQKVNIYVLLQRNKINYDMKLKILDTDKYKVIDYYRLIL